MNSKPTKINQEPGVNGVTRASRPTTIKRTPIVFLNIDLHYRFFFPRQRGINIQKGKKQAYSERSQ